jgi:hypothetical protein
MYVSDEDWDETWLTIGNLCLKHAKRQRRWMHQLWESRTDGEYFKLCKILREFPDKFREYYRMNIKTLLIIFWIVRRMVCRVIQISESGLKQKRDLPLPFGSYCLLW